MKSLSSHAFWIGGPVLHITLSSPHSHVFLNYIHKNVIVRQYTIIWAMHFSWMPVWWMLFLLEWFKIMIKSHLHCRLVNKSYEFLQVFLFVGNKPFQRLLSTAQFCQLARCCCNIPSNIIKVVNKFGTN